MEMKEGLKAEMRQIINDTAKYFKGFPPEWIYNIVTFDCMGDMPGYLTSFGYAGTFNVLRNVCEVEVEKGVETWRVDTIQFFGTWDDCWARATGALVDEDGNTIHNTIVVQKYRRVYGHLKIKAFIWKYVEQFACLSE